MTHYYVLNLQGDVVGLIDENSALVAKYTYSAWGGIISVTDAAGAAITSSTHIANINPLRYRGYYYDTETGFYYLQSRYYDPVTHRFINADSIASTGLGFVGTNMFAYCNNNPVNYCDVTGELLRPYSMLMTDGGQNHYYEPSGKDDMLLSFGTKTYIRTVVIDNKKTNYMYCYTYSATLLRKTKVSFDECYRLDGYFDDYNFESPVEALEGNEVTIFGKKARMNANDYAEALFVCKYAIVRITVKIKNSSVTGSTSFDVTAEENVGAFADSLMGYCVSGATAVYGDACFWIEQPK